MRWRDRAVAVVLALAAAAGPGVPASAAPIGHLTIRPVNSIDTAPIVVRTSAGCPAPADSYYARAKGHGFPAAGLIVTAPTAAGLSHTGAFDVYFAETMKDFAADNHATLSGRYDVTVFCADSFTQSSFGEFTGSLTFTSPTRYVSAAGRASAAKPAQAAPEAAVASAESAAPRPAPTAVDRVSPGASSVTTAGAPGSPRGGAPVVWLVIAAVAALLLAFEGGRRVGRAQRR